MALQSNFVTIFFQNVFPRVGIGLVILLLFIIFTGLFADPKKKGFMYAMYGLGAVILVVILARTGSVVGWLDSFGFYNINWMALLPWIILIVVIAAIVGAGRERPKGEPDGVFARLLKE